MNDRRKPWRQTMCGTKVSFDSRKAALISLRHLRYKRTGISKHHRPYLCPHCYHWHIGSSGRHHVEK